MGGQLRHIGVVERRARLALRQRLAVDARAATPEEVADALVALHGTDPATVYLAVGARLADAGAVGGAGDAGLGQDARDAISTEAARLQAWVGWTRVTPRFRTPLERELSSG